LKDFEKMWEIASFNRLPVLIEKNFLETFGVEVIFTLKSAGDMSDACGEIHHGIVPPPDENPGIKNFAPIAICRQIHGNHVIKVNALPGTEKTGGREGETEANFIFMAVEGDGLITDEKYVALGIRTADCAPVFLFSDIEKKIAAIHVGRRGALAGIIEKTISGFFKNPTEIRAAVGPHIKKCCYNFSDKNAPTDTSILKFGRFYSDSKIDLTGYIKDRLISSGVGDENISIAPYCTSCGGSEKFFSHRRSKGKEKSRHLALIRMKK